ncbi:hypothetical protein HPULCUR_001406 [Helicostylum pulchrum]|uniref:MULE transposase domain-containing protein n=1 Tax=Helicostylum pulchrum TaxID=562976 RepID=A0ABP9XNL5_9FUNG
MKTDQYAIDDDDFQEPVQVNVEDNDGCPEGRVLVLIESVDPYHELGPTEDILYDWAKKNILISLNQSLKSTECILQSSSHKTDCPFILRITYQDLQNLWSLNEPKNEMEHTHNHPCTATYNSISPFGKKLLTTQQDVKVIARMTNNNSKITEIMKKFTKFRSNPILNYQDVANISSEIKQGGRPNSTIADARSLINNMKSKGYHVRRQVSQNIHGEPIKLKNIFFIHNNMIANARKMGQVFIIDATYSTNNNAKMPLVSIYGVHNLGSSKLVTFLVAFAFACNEQESTYKWVLEQLNDLIVTFSSEKHPLFAKYRKATLDYL